MEVIKSHSRNRCIKFLLNIGLTVKIVKNLPSNGFLKGVYIDRGALFITSETPISNLLHEAGHVAVFPKKYRHLIQGDVDKAAEQMFDDLTHEAFDSKLMRFALHSSETEATAWAWAVGKHLNLTELQIIEDEQYEGAGKEIRAMLSFGQYFGINGLAHAGMATRSDYPKLIRWLQD
jgi:hypothetical protein